MKRPTLVELERRCQKPDHRRVGNWMARRVTRPLALRVTWLISPMGLSAHAMTLAAMATGVLAACALGYGEIRTWILGAALLQLWYLLDHVDGQLARLHGTASLDGVQLDYLMHHLLALVMPIGVGQGVAQLAGEPAYAHAGLVWGVAVLLVGLHNDTRYKAFMQRLKRVSGRLEVVGGGGARPEPPPGPQPTWRSWAGWSLKKACEMHVTMNLLSLLAAGMLISSDWAIAAARLYLLAMAAVATLVAVAVLVRSLNRQAAEREFAAWYQPPPGSELVFAEGWWLVEPRESGNVEAVIVQEALPPARSS
jgi:phosphatidylglycerophosphate synthase